MSLDVNVLAAALRASWAADTSDAPELWSTDNPSRGQCAVTAKVVQDYLGGSLLIADVVREGESVERHCWNVLPSGEHLDLTAEQFTFPYELHNTNERAPIVDNGGIDRHALLAHRVRLALQAGAQEGP